MTKNKIERWLKEGRGQGIGVDYKPWLTVQDVPSAGRSHREIGIKTPRQFTFFSDLENRYFHILEYSASVIDIREQYPLLPIEETIFIADDLGIKHPTDPTTGENVVMTTSFLITITQNGQNRLLARTVKSSSELDSKRKIEKLEIERRYWEKQGVDWGIVTEYEINRLLADNIKAIRNYYDLKICGLFEGISDRQIQSYLSQLTRELCGDLVVVRNICCRFDEKNGLEPGSALALYKHLAVTRQLDVNIINEPLELAKPVTIKLLEYKKVQTGVEII
ncbi:TnsA endonuclease N-terminal domain-containing protein [Pelotomaculum sp. FP]|uniref:TnsA endonuclease N-terminal domain-containing protein n=1 Tax=Pelotomaculum sp. FP TaxID=261474 RepID=UPI00195F4D52|nr:TnsA endonuclease N-terminal domain-containing protein [Pelotomaculum sp. FP]